MRVFIDTNVMLDLLGERENFYIPAAKIATLADQDKIEIFVSSLSFATVSYFLAKYEGMNAAKSKLRKFKVLSEICELDEKIIDKGLSSDFTDFEDALQYYSAVRKDCKVLITRNEKDFKLSKIPIMSPVEFLSSL